MHKDRATDRVSCCHSHSVMNAPHLPPAVCHSERDGHGRPFAPTRRRLLTVPEDDDLEQEKEEMLLQEHTEKDGGEKVTQQGCP